MNVQLDWQVGDENGEWETIATIERHPRRKVPWRTLSKLLAALVLSVMGGWLVLRYRYDRALYQAALQIQDVIDLETRALGCGDLDLFMAQQDETSPVWYARQARRASTLCSQPDAGTLDPFLSQGILPDRCPPLSPTEVQSVDLLGDIAWVEVLSQDTVHQVHFYQRTVQGWKHTAPQVEFWKDPVAQRVGSVTVRCHERDLAHVEPLVEHILTTFDDLCAMLGCPPDTTLDVDFVPVDGIPHLSGHRLTLASPLLSGIPVEGRWDKEYLDELSYWVAYETMFRFVRSMDAGTPNGFEKAVLGEYATLYTQGYTTQDPILGDVVERYGVDLPAALRAVMSIRPLSQQRKDSRLRPGLSLL